jgi:hypothetical protein
MGASMKFTLHTGEVVSIAHLAEDEIRCPCESINRELVIKVTYKNHCYTEVWNQEKHTREEILLYDSPDRPRAFCPIRYKLSFELPKLINELQKKRVYQTPEARNYVYVVSLTISNQIYEIYFMLQRAQSGDRADLRLTVESAYADTELPVTKKRPRAIRFLILAQKVLMKQEIKFAAR